jgi:hypothetical protein
MEKNMFTVVFVFSHPMLLNVWREAEKVLAAESISVTLVNQGARIEGEKEITSVFEEADAVYFSGIRHFPNFDTLVSLCKKVPYVVAAGIEATTALGIHDESSVKRVEAYFRAGSVQDLTNAVRFLLYKSGVLQVPPAEPTRRYLFRNASGCWRYVPPGGMRCA